MTEKLVVALCLLYGLGGRLDLLMRLFGNLLELLLGLIGGLLGLLLRGGDSLRD